MVVEENIWEQNQVQVDWEEQYGAVHSAYSSLTNDHAQAKLQLALANHKLTRSERELGMLRGVADSLSAEVESARNDAGAGWEKWKGIAIELMQYIEQCLVIGELEEDERIEEILQENRGILWGDSEGDNED